MVATAAVCDLDLAVIGGGVAQAGDLLFSRCGRRSRSTRGCRTCGTLRVEPAKLGTSAGLYGAAALAYSLT